MSRPAGVPRTIEEFVSSPERQVNLVVPWVGPYIDPETNDLARPLPETALVATSVGWPKEGVEEKATELNQAIVETLFAGPGLCAVMLAIVEDAWNAARNIVVWEDPEALDTFLHSPAHSYAARYTRELMHDWEGTNWAPTSRTALPDLDEARARLTAARGSASPWASPHPYGAEPTGDDR